MTGKPPLVSLVVPSYNHARYLEAAIDSVLAQDYPQIELIVIDDGSTDGSAALLEKYRGRFHWEAQSNRGQAATMNRGWRMSRGELLAYLSADDLLLPHAVSTAVRYLQDHPEAVLAYCDFNLIDPDSAVIRRVRAPEFDYREMVTQMICPPGPGAFFRRSAFERAGDWGGYRQYADYEFWLRLALQGRFVRIPEVLACFRVHPASQSFAPSPPAAAAEEPIRIMEAYFASPQLPAELRGARAEALSAAQLLSARLHLRSGSYRQGLAAARRAFTLYPPNVLAWRTLRLAFNALFNRLGHRVLWTLRGVLRRSG